MTMLDKKEMKFEELNSVTGGNTVGPVNETVPHGIAPNDYPPTNRIPARWEQAPSTIHTS